MLKLVLDGGTGFLKVGYAAQVRGQRAIAWAHADRILELPRVLISLHSRATYSAIGGKSRGYRGEGYHVW